MDQNDKHPDKRQTPERDTPAASGDSRRLRRTILIVFACMMIFVAVTIPLLKLIEKRESMLGQELQTHKSATVIFCTPDYEYDIMQDPEYLALNRYMFYEDMTTGMTEMVDDAVLNAGGPPLKTLVTMVECIIAGDADGYNTLFSDAYFAAHEPEDPFTMQQVYDIKLSKRAVSRVTPEEGRPYTQYEFVVEYKIHKNNGTFRTDIGHDESRRQVFILSDSGSGVAYIDEIWMNMTG